MAVAATIMFASCNKPAPELPQYPNPEIHEYVGAGFTLTAVETRTGTDFAWTVSKDGKTDSVDEQIDQMYVTTYSTISFTVVPDDPTGSFTGVNITSSLPSAVQVEKINETTFILKRPLIPYGSEAVIEVWNGNGSSENKISFTVKSQQLVWPIAFIVEVDGKDMELPLYGPDEEALKEMNCLIDFTAGEKTNDINQTTIHKIVFKGVIPENTSYRVVEMNHFNVSKEWRDYLETKGYDYTFWSGEYDEENREKNSRCQMSLETFCQHNVAYVALCPDAPIGASQFIGDYIYVTIPKAPYAFCAGYYMNVPFDTYEDFGKWRTHKN